MKSASPNLNLNRIRRHLAKLINQAHAEYVSWSDAQGDMRENQRRSAYAGGKREGLIQFQKYIRTQLRLAKETEEQKKARSRRLHEAALRRRRVARRLEKKGQIYGEDDLDWMPS